MKKLICALLAAALTLLAGCSSGGTSSSEASSGAPAESAPPSSQDGEPESSASQEAPAEKIDVNIASLKGPTSMGLVQVMEQSEAGGTANNYHFTMAGTADEIVAQIAKGELDIAAVPCNLASVLYNNTEGKISIAAINTLGVLYVVDTDGSVQSIGDLRGKTVYSTGKNTTPEAALNFVLSQNGIDPASDLTIEYKSEATEVAALMSEGGATVAMLPEPFVTTAMQKNDRLRVALDLTEEWDKVGDGSSLVTGVVIVRNEFLQEHGEAFERFLDEYKASTEWVNSSVEEAAALVEKYGIAPAAVAGKAIPKCSITFIDGADMKTKVSGYLQVLFEQNPKLVGGKLPDDAFYYQR